MENNSPLSAREHPKGSGNGWKSRGEKILFGRRIALNHVKSPGSPGILRRKIAQKHRTGSQISCDKKEDMNCKGIRQLLA